MIVPACPKNLLPDASFFNRIINGVVDFQSQVDAVCVERISNEQ